ncbi:MAG: filamentous hemagglutinin family protein [Methylacidiphilales bacterium]|nr:filamentous hemagglutinin family protein [Candidatus Methylacidiphilales bacterium]
MSLTVHAANRLTGLGMNTTSHGSTSNTTTSQTSTAATAATNQSEQTSVLARNAEAALQNSLKALQAQQAAQSAARASALNITSSVPNGLATGGLVPDSGLARTGVANPVTTWVNAKTPTQSVSNGQTTVTVTQTAQQALLNWQTFNIGKNTTLDFDQSAGGADVAQWVAINKVAASIAPSQILGSIQAPGQVYVINQNGIIFDGSSQVNVGALVASSLPINDNLIARGLLNNPDLQFLFSQSNIAAGTQGPTPAFTPAPAPTSGTVAKVDSAGNLSLVSASGHDGDVMVEAGAQLTSPASSTNVGGKIALVGPNVTNAGTISTPDGQTILAAGLQVGFQEHDTNDPTLRGLDVYVGAVDSSSGVATNVGLIGTLTSSGQIEPTPGADVTITGKQVNQLGLIDLSTSVSLNSRVDLLADYNTESFFNGKSGFNGTTGFYPTASGPVTLGPGSATELTCDSSTTDTVVGSELALSSLVDIQGSSIEMGTDSLLLAPSASVPSNASQPVVNLTGATLSSGVTLNAGQWALLYGQESFYNSSGSISLDDGATIDVSGSENVAASVAENIVAAQLLSSELANSPLQQNGPLEGQTIYVNLLDVGVYDGTAWIGTPLANVSGYVNLVQHNVGELTTNGGTVSLNAGTSVNLNAGSTVNVSGGWINYQGGVVQTTKVAADGKVYDISAATPNRVYDGIYTGYTATSAKWGISQSYANSLLQDSQYQAGYLQGGNGGSLSITAPTMTLNGNFYGNTVAGTYQRTLASVYDASSSAYANSSFLPTILSTLAVPASSSLKLNFVGETLLNGAYSNYSPGPADIVFQSAGGPQVTDPFAASGYTELDLSSDLVNADGFGNLTIVNSNGNFYVPADVMLAAAPGGSISFEGANIRIDGSLSAPGGTLAFIADDYSPYAIDSPGAGVTPPPDPTRGSFTLGAGASLSVAGLVVDDFSTTSSDETIPLATNGGTLSIKAFNADFAKGSLLDVSGGLLVNEAGAISYGNGGSLSILAGQDPNIAGLVGGQLTLDATLKGYSGATGSSLTVLAPLVQIGNSAAGVATIDPDHTLLLDPVFFNQGGFSSFTIEGLGEVAPNQSNTTDFLPAISISSGVTIDPVVSKWVATVEGNNVSLTPTLFPLASERTPANLSFDAVGVTSASGLEVRGDFVLGANAEIETDPTGKISIAGTTVDLLGDILAPGGAIIIAGAKDSTTQLFFDTLDPLVTVEIGSDSTLSTAGVVELTANAYGYTTGSVLAGGTISVTGNILAEKGAVIDVSGASGILDVSPTQVGSNSTGPSSPALIATRVDSSGGSITLTGGQELVSDATLLGGAGGPSAQGGSLTISSGLFATGLTTSTPLDATLDITQSLLAYSSFGIGNIVSVNGTTAGLGYFAADSFNTSGLDALTLAGTVQFSGPVTINANRSLAVGNSGIIYSDAAVNLIAPYVELGQAFQGPLTIQQQELPVFTDASGNPIAINPTYGGGSITVNAGSLIDVGNLSLQNIGNLNLVSTNGDIRGDGTLDVAGNISLTAGQIYPTTETTFTIAAYDHNGIAGSVTINGSGNRELPLSAGGTLNIFATDITQGGVLRAPIGTINLGSGVTGASPVDPLTGQSFDPTQNLTLPSGSITSVSAVDPVSGQDLTIPYGTILNGVSWIDPAGNDITTTGNGANAVPDKTINVSAANVTDQSGATIDISGGGDLYAYRFVSGTGGTNDILALTTSYAVIPGYSASYAPYYSSSDYANSTLGVGSQVYLSASSGLPAGVYTLLPARYALLPGASLITPTSTTPPVATTVQPDGSTVVSGYIFNGLDKTQTSSPLLTSFEVASQSVVKSRAEYDSYSANTFLGQNAVAQGISVRLPIDAGRLVLAATSTMTLQGTVSSETPKGGLGSQVDLASPDDILISGPNTDLSGVSSGTLVLDSSDLSAFGADSLLIGGYRTSTTEGTAVTVTTNNVTVDNSGAALTGPDVILTSNKTLTLDPDAEVEQSGSLSSSAETLILGNSSFAGSGDGVLLRVSSDASAQVGRVGVDSSTGPSLKIGAGATMTGTSLTLDSTSATVLDPTANLSGGTVSIDSGQINLVLDNSQPAAGLVLSSSALATLQASAQALSLLSYSSIDIYGSGEIGGVANNSGDYPIQSFALHAGEITGENGGTVTINADQVTLDDSGGGISSDVAPAPAGGLVVNAGIIQLGGGTGVNTLNLDGYAAVQLNASKGVILAATGATSVQDASGNPVNVKGIATLEMAGNLSITTPLIVGATGSDETIKTTGSITVASSGSTATVTGGLGGTLDLTGSSVTVNSNIVLPSGDISIEANGPGGNVVVGGRLDTGGVAQSFNDVTEYTSGGQISLASDRGSVILNSAGTITVAANAGGGDAGSLAISAPDGIFVHNGSLLGQGGTGGEGGAFSVDVGSIPGGSVQTLDSPLDSGGFTQSISIRDRTDANVLVDGTVKAASYTLSVDQGSITVTGTIDASDVAATDAAGNPIKVGGTIDLDASGSVTLTSGSELTVEGQNFSNAGKGGSITLEAGAYTSATAGQWVQNGTGYYDTATAAVDINGGTINLGVNAISAYAVANNISEADAIAHFQFLGDLSGTLQIEAPRTTDNTSVQVGSMLGSIKGASSITVVGNEVYLPADGVIDTTLSQIMSDGNTFLGMAGTTTAGYTAMYNAVFGNLDPSSKAVANIETGVEIDNPSGDLTLENDWDLSTFRFGPNGTPGVLTLRAAGNLIFDGSLSDGFTITDQMYDATLMTANTALPANLQSWSYNLVAGADLSAADFDRVLPDNETYDPATGLAVPGAAGGSVELGVFVSSLNGSVSTTDGQAAEPLDGDYQVIRTGTGNIDIATSGDVLLQNQFATIYTAGVQAPDIANFDTPVLSQSGLTTLYPAQYSMAGGNVTISAHGNIAHVTLNNNTGTVVIDSQKELPNNWLYRRGYVVQSTDPTAGTGVPGDFGTIKNGDIGSTTWWVDFSNFFEGVGALGGGDVTLNAGHDISDVDAVAPTNARVPYENAEGNLVAADQTIVELGGGNVVVSAGNDINAGVYYVERGQGTLEAGNGIITNYTRSPSTGALTSKDVIDDSNSWLPTTLFLGEGSFDVTAQNDLLLGPVSNPFLLPQGVNNTYWDKSYFSTYATTDAVDVASLTGTVTLRTEASPDTGIATPLLQVWLQDVDQMGSGSSATVANYQPWVKTTETSIVPFLTLDALQPSTLEATAFSGDIDLVGNLTLSPSPTGNISLLAAGSLNGLQPDGTSVVNDDTTWSSSTINLSDADPAAIPGIYSPYAYENEVGTNPAAAKTTGGQIRINGVNTSVSLNFSFINSLFAESGSTEGTYGVLQTKQELHASIDNLPLHANDLVPVRLYASDGDISGITLFAGKQTRVIAGQDITDISLYIQNDTADSISIVAAGRDILPYDANAPLLIDAQAAGNILDFGQGPLAGDIQISGPGTLEVLAGRNLNLGDGSHNSDGTGVGISSIGNDSNPVLPFAGADIVAAAGLDSSAGFDASQLNFANASHLGFIDLFLDPATGGVEAERYLPDLGSLLDLPTGDSDAQIWDAFNQLPTEKQDLLALDIFYLVLRDAGRDHNDPSSPGAGNYNAGYAAIKALFPGSAAGASWPGEGDLSLTSREIKTTNGGNISLLVPGGQLNVGLNVSGVQPLDQGILTEDGGDISIFASGSVNVGTSRIFTLNGGNEIIWSTTGDIDAGASSKTVQSAPPTRVLVDPQSGAVETDLSGLATGGGIGVLETVAGAPPSDVDLIAPNGTVNAGDAGIRASGNLNISAVQVLNAGNIQVGGKSTGVPTVVAPNVAGLTAASSAMGSTTSAADQAAQAARNQAAQENQPDDGPSIITVVVLGYGGNSENSDNPSF